MKGYNVVWVFNPGRDRVLMCLRRKDPYKGLYNLVGGKIEPGESSPDAAWRELREETGIDRGDIDLLRLMDFVYPLLYALIGSLSGRSSFGTLALLTLFLAGFITLILARKPLEQLEKNKEAEA